MPNNDSIYATPEEIAEFADVPDDPSPTVVIGNRLQYYIAFALFILSVFIFSRNYVR